MVPRRPNRRWADRIRVTLSIRAMSINHYPTVSASWRHTEENGLGDFDSNRVKGLRPLLPRILEALAAVTLGQLITVGG